MTGETDCTTTFKRVGTSQYIAIFSNNPRIGYARVYTCWQDFFQYQVRDQLNMQAS